MGGGPDTMSKPEAAVLDYHQDLAPGSKSEMATTHADAVAANLSREDKDGLGGLLAPPLSMHTEFAPGKAEEYGRIMTERKQAGDSRGYERASDKHAGYVLDGENFAAAELDYNLFCTPANLAVRSVQRVQSLEEAGLGKTPLDPSFAEKHRKGFAKALDDTRSHATGSEGALTNASSLLSGARGELLSASIETRARLTKEVIDALRKKVAAEQGKKDAIEGKIADVVEIVSTIGEVGALLSGSTELSGVGEAHGDEKAGKIGAGVDDSSGMVGEAVSFGMHLVLDAQLQRIQARIDSMTEQQGHHESLLELQSARRIAQSYATKLSTYNNAARQFVYVMGQQRERYAQAGRGIDKAEHRGKDGAHDEVAQAMMYTSAVREAKVLLASALEAARASFTSLTDATTGAAHRQPERESSLGDFKYWDNPDVRAGNQAWTFVGDWIKVGSEEHDMLEVDEAKAEPGLKSAGMGSGEY
jgi:hypothetical protein